MLRRFIIPAVARFPLFLLASLSASDRLYADNVRIGVTELTKGSFLSAHDGTSQILRSALYGSIIEQPLGTFELTTESPGQISIIHKKDVSCSDGGLLNTQDLVFSLEHCLQARGKSGHVERIGPPDLISDAAPGVIIRGDFSLLDEIKSCPLMRSWAMSIFGADGGRLGTSVGCGAFRVESILPGRKITLTSNQTADSAVSTITVQRILDDSNRLSLLRRAEIDMFFDPTEEEQLSIGEDPTLVAIQCNGFKVATRRVLRVECQPHFFSSLLRWEHGSSHANS